VKLRAHIAVKAEAKQQARPGPSTEEKIERARRSKAEALAGSTPASVVEEKAATSDCGNNQESDFCGLLPDDLRSRIFEFCSTGLLGTLCAVSSLWNTTCKEGILRRSSGVKSAFLLDNARLNRQVLSHSVVTSHHQLRDQLTQYHNRLYFISERITESPVDPARAHHLAHTQSVEAFDIVSNEKFTIINILDFQVEAITAAHGWLAVGGCDGEVVLVDLEMDPPSIAFEGRPVQVGINHLHITMAFSRPQMLLSSNSVAVHSFLLPARKQKKKQEEVEQQAERSQAEQSEQGAKTIAKGANERGGGTQWSCAQCTFLNEPCRAVCEMCATAREALHKQQQSAYWQQREALNEQQQRDEQERLLYTQSSPTNLVTLWVLPFPPHPNCTSVR
jgi:hypothetical protein